ncbi:hypothetical protein [Lapillicoccus jejuensis]|uniref:Uncharacterized protein n=1 Tax=Lapillicoccus jejuensis TaxID=402171 RepID=A0A542E0Y1_9MICO|nr:hypothetical protein [Lapillicoccus jejuensis]TQJ09008.1 hypothetical protein FB458_2110 [Lapillicoccus jejuensis]
MSSIGHDTLRVVVVLAVLAVGVLTVVLVDRDAARCARRPAFAAVALVLLVGSVTGVVQTVRLGDGFATALYGALLAAVALATARVVAARR